MDVDSATRAPATPAPAPQEKIPTFICPEVPAYLGLLVCMYLLDTKHLNEALQCSKLLVQQSRRLDTVVDSVIAKFWFYYSRVHELLHQMSFIRKLAFCGCRTNFSSELLAAYRTASLRHMDETKVTRCSVILLTLFRLPY